MGKRLIKIAVRFKFGFYLMGKSLLAASALLMPVHAVSVLMPDQIADYQEFAWAANISSVSISGDTAVLGIRKYDGVTGRSGEALVFTNYGQKWVEQARLTPMPLEEDDRSFGVSVAISGDTLVVGAPTSDSSAANSGSVYVFTRSESTWTQQARLVASNAAEAYRFGRSVAIEDDTVIVTTGSNVAINNDTVVVGAPHENNGDVTDSVYAFHRIGSEWIEQDLHHGEDDMGVSPQNPTGSACIFTRNNNEWNKQAVLLASDGASNDRFGASVAISGETILVGAPSARYKNQRIGAAYVFVRDGSAWNQQEILTDMFEPDFFRIISGSLAYSDLAGYDFGTGVAISGDRAVISSNGIERDIGLENFGLFNMDHLYIRTESKWNPRALLVAGDWQMSSQTTKPVAISDKTVITGTRGVGARTYNLSCNTTYSLPPNQWHQISLPCDPGPDNTVEAVLADDIPGTYGADWQVYRYEHDGFVLLGNSDELIQGVGYWILQTGDSDVALDMPNTSTPTPMEHNEEWKIPLMRSFTSGINESDVEPLMGGPKIPTLAGNNTACNEQDTDCVVVTQSAVKQWSSIGYLFSTDCLLAEAAIYTDTGTCSINSGCDLDTAQSQGILYNQLWTYNGAEYVAIKATDNLLPWKGYWAALLQNAEGQNPSLQIRGTCK